MAITLAYAKRWCTKPEWDVIGASFKENYKRLSEARLKEKIRLTRRMRDKFRDLAKHQKGEMRGKRKVRGKTPTVDSHLNDKKAKLFNEALERYQGYLAELGPAAAGASSSKGAGKAKSATRRKVASKTRSKPKKKVAAKKTSSKATKVAKKKRRTRSERLERREELRKKFAEKKKKEAAAQKKKKQVQKKAVKSQASTANSKGSRKAANFQRNRSKVIQTHIKSSGKRNQAKRDAN